MGEKIRIAYSYLGGDPVEVRASRDLTRAVLELRTPRGGGWQEWTKEAFLRAYTFDQRWSLNA